MPEKVGPERDRTITHAHYHTSRSTLSLAVSTTYSGTAGFEADRFNR